MERFNLVLDMFLLKDWEIAEILDDIILGRGVKRTIHDLQYDEKVYTQLFIERLQLFKFRPVAVKNIQIEVGKRSPAFYIKGKTAIFGYIFREVFSEKHKRKIWGSVVRNEKGDWKYILPGNSGEVVFINLNKQEEIDIFHLS